VNLPADTTLARFGFQDQAPDLFMVLDRNWRCAYINPIGAQQIGGVPEELIGREVREFFPEGVSGPTWRAYERAMNQGESVLAEEYFAALRRWFEVRVYPVDIGIAVHFVDVTDRKLTEVALRESEERFRELGTHSRDVIWIVALNPQRILYCSPALEPMWGMAPAELYADPLAWKPRVHPEDQRRINEAWDEACVSGTFEAEYRVVRPDGSIRWLSDLLTPVRNASGELISLSGVSRDVTEQKRLERAVMEVADRERRSLGADLHDGLGQELTGIALMIGALAQSSKKRGPHNSQEFAQLEAPIKHAIETCRAIAHGLSPLGYASGGLIGALQQLARLQADRAGAPAVRFKAETLAPLRLLPDALDQLFRIAQEGVSNALRHSRARRIDIRLAIEPALVRLQIQDDGIGLAPKTAGAPGMGLKILQYRSALIGARLSIGAGASGGTLVGVECPQPP
jgi:PAS domain S-box-containing protein